jgi:hypothetical protein
MIRKTTDEIRELLTESKLDFNEIVNEALNAYLPQIFHSCPFSEDVCTKERCIECAVFHNVAEERARFITTKTRLQVESTNVSVRERI